MICININLFFFLTVVGTKNRPWPLLTNEGLTEEELEIRRRERRARIERQRDRDRNRDTRRGVH